MQNIIKTKIYVLLDGAIAIQDPSMLTLLKAMHHYPDTDHFVIVTLGTGKFQVVHAAKKMQHLGLLKWLPYAFPMLILARAKKTIDLSLLTKINTDRSNTGNSTDFTLQFFPIDVRIPEDVATHQFSADKNTYSFLINMVKKLSWITRWSYRKSSSYLEASNIVNSWSLMPVPASLKNYSPAAARNNKLSVKNYNAGLLDLNIF